MALSAWAATCVEEAVALARVGLPPGTALTIRPAPRPLLQVDFRWKGDANIIMGIELPVGGSLTRMAPKVSDLAVSGTARIVLRPLLETIPGFGAALVSLRAPPIVRFHLDFGRAFGGSSSAAAIRLWLDDFLRNQIAEMMLWPARVVVPILSEDVTGPLDSLYLTCVDWGAQKSGRVGRRQAFSGLGKWAPQLEWGSPGLLPESCIRLHAHHPKNRPRFFPFEKCRRNAALPMPLPWMQAPRRAAGGRHRGSRPAQGGRHGIRRLLCHRVHHRPHGTSLWPGSSWLGPSSTVLSCGGRASNCRGQGSSMGGGRCA